MSKTANKLDNACCVWDFTIYDIREVQELRAFLKGFTKKYAFQLEKGEKKGKDHYQGRISLKVKERKSQVIKRFEGWKGHITVTSKVNMDNQFYVMKEDTRIAGPYTDENEVYIPRDIKAIKELRPWQQSMKEHLLHYEDRIVDMIIDMEGCKGKTVFSRYMQIFHGAQLLPMVNDYKDIMRMGYCCNDKPIFFIDMPRSMEKKKLKGLFAGIESLKGGYAYDDRYTFKQTLFDPPRVCVFTNKVPNLDYLSRDRWKLWEIEGDNLKEYQEEASEED